MTSATPSPELRDQFRAGFFHDRPAPWIEQVEFTLEPAVPDVAGSLEALEGGQRTFHYPGHDPVVYRVLQELVRAHDLRRGADIGSATGTFPAMQLAAGIELCTVFEQRPLEADHERVEVRVQDLSQDTGLKPEFDLVTCLSTIEHVGLGRYGDPLDPWGDVRLAQNLRKIVRPGGFVVMSFPVGAGCVVFNMHRIYSPLRRSLLFDGYDLVATYPDRTLARRVVHELRRLAYGRLERSRQPIYVLRVPDPASGTGIP